MIKEITEGYKKLPIQARASLCFLICSFLQRGISVITTPIFTRILSTTEYGQFSVFNSWMQLITPIISLNLSYGVYSQGIIKFEDDKAKFSSSLQGLSITLIMVWIVLYLMFQDYFNTVFSLSTFQMISMFFMIWLAVSFQFWSKEQRVDFKYQKLVLITLLVSVLQPILSIVLILNSRDKVTARILGILIIQMLFYSGTFVVQMKKGKTFFSKKYWKYALTFNIPLLPHYLSLTVLSSSDRIMISEMVGDDKAGIYNLAYSISMIMSMFNMALLQTIEPWIYKKIKDHKVKDIESIAYVSFVLIAGVNILLIMFAPEVISLFAPQEYQEAVYIIPAVALSVYFMFLYEVFATFEFYFEKKKYIVFATVGGAVLNIILNYIFIRIFGYMAAGYTTLFGYMLFVALHYYFMRKVCKEFFEDVRPYNFKIILGISGIAVMFGFLFLLVYRNIILRYCLIMILFMGAVFMRKKIIRIMLQFWSTIKSKKEKNGS